MLHNTTSVQNYNYSSLYSKEQPKDRQMNSAVQVQKTDIIDSQQSPAQTKTSQASFPLMI